MSHFRKNVINDNHSVAHTSDIRKGYHDNSKKEEILKDKRKTYSKNRSKTVVRTNLLDY